MPIRKPKVGVNELYCELCWKRNEFVTFRTMAALNKHLFEHFIDAAPAKIIASA